MKSSTYLRAYEDLSFMHADDLRPVRLQLELLKPELALREEGITSTVVVFGSTRTGPRAQMRRNVKELEKKLARKPKSRALALELAAARRLLAKSKYYDEARRFSRIVTSTCQIDGRCDYVIVTGGGPGIMEAANRGAFDVGGKSIGLNITLPLEQFPNPYITPRLCFQFHYFALRKMHFLMRAKAMVAFPGGYGTMDELFETLTLVQTGKVESLPIILFGKEFWTRAIDFKFLRDEGVIAPADVKLFRFADTAEQAWSMILDFHGGTTGKRGATRHRRGQS
ncbi:MAG: LOG family protein [Acidobacteriota bacterium]